MSSDKDFLPSSSPISSIFAIEIEAIVFLFMTNCYKSSLQECITIIVLKIERTRNRPPYCLLQIQELKKRWHSASPGRVVLRHPSPSPRVCTDGQTCANVRTKSFRINRLPNLLTHDAPRAPLKFQQRCILKNYIKSHSVTYHSTSFLLEKVSKSLF